MILLFCSSTMVQDLFLGAYYANEATKGRKEAWNQPVFPLTTFYSNKEEEEAYEYVLQDHTPIYYGSKLFHHCVLEVGYKNLKQLNNFILVLSQSYGYNQKSVTRNIRERDLS